MIIPIDFFKNHILIGDETALPAICRRLEELPSGGRARVFVEIHGPGSEIDLRSNAELEVTWAHRCKTEHVSPLLELVRTADLVTDGAYAWVACESSDAKMLRAHLVGERGLRSELR